MSKVAKDMLENQNILEQEIQELFQKIDTDHSKEIDKKEFRAFAMKLYQKSGKKITNEMVDKFMKTLDTDKNGTLSIDEFREYAIKVLQMLSKEK